ncbi:hypothetical protein FB451DRAFT_1167818 [Mycena latifolia]|nr:hypothetical protein FB451DRAFT_1167818 [Mycena latifolia]
MLPHPWRHHQAVRTYHHAIPAIVLPSDCAVHDDYPASLSSRANAGHILAVQVGRGRSVLETSRPSRIHSERQLDVLCQHVALLGAKLQNLVSRSQTHLGANHTGAPASGGCRDPIRRCYAGPGEMGYCAEINAGQRTLRAEMRRFARVGAATAALYYMRATPIGRTGGSGALPVPPARVAPRHLLTRWGEGRRKKWRDMGSRGGNVRRRETEAQERGTTHREGQKERGTERRRRASLGKGRVMGGGRRAKTEEEGRRQAEDEGGGAGKGVASRSEAEEGGSGGAWREGTMEERLSRSPRTEGFERVEDCTRRKKQGRDAGGPAGKKREAHAGGVQGASQTPHSFLEALRREPPRHRCRRGLVQPQGRRRGRKAPRLRRARTPKATARQFRSCASAPPVPTAPRRTPRNWTRVQTPSRAALPAHAHANALHHARNADSDAMHAGLRSVDARPTAPHQCPLSAGKGGPGVCRHAGCKSRRLLSPSRADQRRHAWRPAECIVFIESAPLVEVARRAAPVGGVLPCKAVNGAALEGNLS